MGAEDWFFTGDDAEKYLKQEAKRQEVEEKRRKEDQKNKVYRFYLPVGAETQITFVDDITHPDGYRLPFVVKEHQVQLRGDWKNWFTCLADIRTSVGESKECPPCKIGNFPSVISAYTVIDHSVWEDKKGKVHQDEIKLFAAKSKTVKQLEKFLAKYGTLRGLKFDVSRTDSQKAAVGDTFIVDEQVELKPDIQPLDYKAIFQPKSVEELKDILGIYEEGLGGEVQPIRF